MSQNAAQSALPIAACGVGPASPGDVRRAIRASLPAVLAALPMGIAFGVVVAQSPLDWWWAPVFATVIFAGSLEFLILGMVVSLAPLASIAATAFLVNFRHVFYALSFPLHRVHGRGAKVYSTFTLTDEAWALTASAEAQTWSRRRILAIQASFQVAWLGGVTAGALGGTLIPEGVVGLDFALTAFFLVLGIDAYRIRRSIPIPIVALGCALAGFLVFGEGMLVAAMAMFVAFLRGALEPALGEEFRFMPFLGGVHERGVFEMGEPLEPRYERTEAELFARIEGLGRELQNRVTGDDSKRLKVQGEKAQTRSAAEYGSADHHQAFAASLAGTASEERVKGRLAAARGESTHPSTALATSKAPAKAQKTSPGAALGAQKSKNGPSR